MGSPTILAKKLPNVAPITNNGVTSPPWNPVASVIDVNSSFIINAYGITELSNDFANNSKLRPKYILFPINNIKIIIIIPPIKLFTDVFCILSENAFFKKWVISANTLLTNPNNIAHNITL